MPYKLVGKTIWVKRRGKWRKLKTHETRVRALAHLRALKANVKEG